MGRIDQCKGQDATMRRRHIQQMLRHIDEYEQVKKKEHPKYRYAQEFYEAKGLLRQNFLKYYRRFLLANRDIQALIPHKTGRKFKDVIQYEPEVLERLKALRAKGYNRYDIAYLLKKRHDIDFSSSGIYRLMRKLGINKLNPKIKEEVRRIIKKEAGELGHIDIHYVSKGTVKEMGNKKLYILGIMDSFSRICWVQPITSIKAIDVSYAAMEAMVILQKRYGVEFKEILSDNGSEFASRNNPHHPFEKMLNYLEIKHRYTKPCTPKTNGKIERFWRTIEEELLSGETFDTYEEFCHYIKGYSLYYNEKRMHQGINLKKPVEMLPGELNL